MLREPLLKKTMHTENHLKLMLESQEQQAAQQEQQEQILQETAAQQQQQQQELIWELAAQHQVRQERLIQQVVALLQPQGTSNTVVPGSVGDTPSAGLPIWLTKMGPEDDPEAFLVTFEWVTIVAHWPAEHWTTLIAPHLTSPAQDSYQSLDPTEVLDNAKVKITRPDFLVSS